MTKIFIIHGTKGSPKGNWFPWLKKELEKGGHTVFVPKFPTPKNQSLENWMKAFEHSQIDDKTILIGHSLGAAFILSVLEKKSTPIKACFLVSGFLGLLGNKEFDELNKTFITKTLDWKKIKKNCKKFYVINSDNDPYVPLEKGKELAQKLGTELIVLKKAGHINAEAGYTAFPLLLDLVKKEISGITKSSSVH